MAQTLTQFLTEKYQQKRDLILFILIGGTAALAYIGLCTGLLALFPVWPRALVSALAYGLLVGPVYLCHHKITFRSTRAHKAALPRYVATQAIATGLTALLGLIFYHWLNWPNLAGAVMITGLTSVISYVLGRFWTFGSRA